MYQRFKGELKVARAWFRYFQPSLADVLSYLLRRVWRGRFFFKTEQALNFFSVDFGFWVEAVSILAQYDFVRVFRLDERITSGEPNFELLTEVLNYSKQ